jgi:hypothetical protein
VKIMRSKENLTTICGLSREETELDFSGQDLGAGDAVLIANDISDMGALSVLNLAENNLGELVLPEGWTEDYDSDEDEEVYKHTDGREQKDNPGKPEGIIAIAKAIPDMRALLQFDISNNDIRAEGGKALVEALRGNQVINTLSIAENDLSFNSSADQDMSALVALAGVIPGMGAISTVTVNTFPLPIQDIKSKAELDFSGKELQVEDIIIIAALIPSNVSHNPYIYLLLIFLSVTRGR